MAVNFEAFDTETKNRPGGGEAVALFRTLTSGGRIRAPFKLFPKDFEAVFEFLAPADKGMTKFVAWNMDFDTRAIVHDNLLPFQIAERVGIFGRAKWRTKGGPFVFKYVPTKFFEVRRGKRGFVIYDLAQFYGSSLAAASKAHLPAGQGKGEIPEEWYNEMDRCLLDERRARILCYGIRDVLATKALADKLLFQIARLGLRPTRLTSCASLARLKFGKVLGAVRPPDYVNRLYQRSFFGGRIETRALGVVGEVRLYDLASAYPSVFAQLMDPRGDVASTRGRAGWRYRGADYGSYRIFVKVPTSLEWGPLAYRLPTGRIIYPVGQFTTNVGVPGLELLRKHGFEFEVLDANEIFVRDRTPLFLEIPELYAARKSSDMGLAIKTTINAAYGVCAEATNHVLEDDFGSRTMGGFTVRSYSKFGRFSNFIFAAHITETIRVRLWEELNRLGSKAIFAATDGILTTGDVETGSGLGTWGLKGTFEKAVVLGCGRYILYPKFDLTREELHVLTPEYHLRGFPHDAETFEKLRGCRASSAWIPALDTATLKVWAQSVGENLNVLADVKRRLTVSDEKRYWPARMKTVGSAWESVLYSRTPVIREEQ